MFRRRLRPAYSEEDLRRIYHTPHNSNNWEDHKVRVRQTIALGKESNIRPSTGVIADLSCGNGEIARALARHFDVGLVLGDYAFNGEYAFHGPIEQTIDLMPFGVELFVCSETIEHLDDPDKVLRKIRQKAGQLLLSTPIGENDSSNPEHYWGWDQEAVKDMLSNAGWDPTLRVDLHFRNPGFNYDYQIWLCQ